MRESESSSARAEAPPQLANRPADLFVGDGSIAELGELFEHELGNLR